MDMQMPDMDGITATKELRNTLECNIPILAVTANVSERDRQKCFDAGMNGHIGKPLKKDALYRSIAPFL